MMLTSQSAARGTGIVMSANSRLKSPLKTTRIEQGGGLLHLSDGFSSDSDRSRDEQHNSGKCRDRKGQRGSSAGKLSSFHPAAMSRSTDAHDRGGGSAPATPTTTHADDDDDSDASTASSDTSHSSQSSAHSSSTDGAYRRHVRNESTSGRRGSGSGRMLPSPSRLQTDSLNPPPASRGSKHPKGVIETFPTGRSSHLHRPKTSFQSKYERFESKYLRNSNKSDVTPSSDTVGLGLGMEAITETTEEIEKNKIRLENKLKLFDTLSTEFQIICNRMNTLKRTTEKYLRYDSILHHELTVDQIKGAYIEMREIETMMDILLQKKAFICEEEMISQSRKLKICANCRIPFSFLAIKRDDLGRFDVLFPSWMRPIHHWGSQYILFPPKEKNSRPKVNKLKTIADTVSRLINRENTTEKSAISIINHLHRAAERRRDRLRQSWLEAEREHMLFEDATAFIVRYSEYQQKEEAYKKECAEAEEERKRLEAQNKSIWRRAAKIAPKQSMYMWTRQWGKQYSEFKTLLLRKAVSWPKQRINMNDRRVHSRVHIHTPIPIPSNPTVATYISSRSSWLSGQSLPDMLQQQIASIHKQYEPSKLFHYKVEEVWICGGKSHTIVVSRVVMDSKQPQGQIVCDIVSNKKEASIARVGFLTRVLCNDHRNHFATHNLERQRSRHQDHRDSSMFLCQNSFHLLQKCFSSHCKEKYRQESISASKNQYQEGDHILTKIRNEFSTVLFLNRYNVDKKNKLRIIQFQRCVRNYIKRRNCS